MYVCTYRYIYVNLNVVVVAWLCSSVSEYP